MGTNEKNMTAGSPGKLIITFAKGQDAKALAEEMSKLRKPVEH